MVTSELDFYYSENVRPGLKFARKYFDSIEKMMHKDHGQRLGLSSTQLLMNLHNNRAGRLVSDRNVVINKSFLFH